MCILDTSTAAHALLLAFPQHPPLSRSTLILHTVSISPAGTVLDKCCCHYPAADSWCAPQGLAASPISGVLPCGAASCGIELAPGSPISCPQRTGIPLDTPFPGTSIL